MQVTPELIVTGLVAFGARDIVMLGLNRKRNKQQDSNLILAAETAAKKTKAETNSLEVETVRGLLSDVLISRDGLSQELSELKRELGLVMARLTKVEERERHMLARAGAHEAWDQMSFQLLAKQFPNHPPPPPLIDHQELEELEHDALRPGGS